MTDSAADLGETFVPTNCFRYLVPKDGGRIQMFQHGTSLATFVVWPVLQQCWQGSNGSQRWENVSVVVEENQQD